MSPIRKEVIDFIRVTEAGNFSKAADLLGVKQSGLSKSIKRLEDDLGIKLFMRGARHIKLTDAGHLFYQQALDITKNWQKTTQKARALSSEIEGNFSIAFHPVIGKYILPRVMNKILDYPAIELSINLMSSREAQLSVREMKFDIALAVNPLPYPDLVIKPLWKEYIGLYSQDGEQKETLLYNEDMINVLEHISPFNNLKKIAINDYQMIYSVAKRNDKSMCLLPNPIADNEGRMKLIKQITKEIDVCLVYRQDRLKTKGFNFLIDSFKS